MYVPGLNAVDFMSFDVWCWCLVDLTGRIPTITALLWTVPTVCVHLKTAVPQQYKIGMGKKKVSRIKVSFYMYSKMPKEKWLWNRFPEMRSTSLLTTVDVVASNICAPFPCAHRSCIVNYLLVDQVSSDQGFLHLLAVKSDLIKVPTVWVVLYWNGGNGDLPWICRGPEEVGQKKAIVHLLMYSLEVEYMSSATGKNGVDSAWWHERGKQKERKA